MTNKAGFTEEQQRDLTHLIELGQFAAAVMTVMFTDAPEEEIEQVLEEFGLFVKATYPRGPRQVAEKLNEISRFCDLTIVTTVRHPQTGDPI